MKVSSLKALKKLAIWSELARKDTTDLHKYRPNFMGYRPDFLRKFSQSKLRLQARRSNAYN
jgi:hypothetical protein